MLLAVDWKLTDDRYNTSCTSLTNLKIIIVVFVIAASYYLVMHSCFFDVGIGE